MTKASDSFWQPTASIDNLRRRSNLLRQIRDHFYDEGFFEVQTPCLSSETVVDAHLEPISVPSVIKTQSSGQCFYLQTSPEAAMKRLLVAGADRIFQLGPVFRADESGQYHNLEFTMLEWYRRGDTQESAIQFLADLVARVLPASPPEIITYRQLFEQSLGVDPIESDLETLRRILHAGEPSLVPNESWDRDSLLDACMGFLIQPRLEGRKIVCNYPLSQAALARRSERDPDTAERFELFIDGVELANGYAELCDPEILVTRTETLTQQRFARGQPALPFPAKLIAAMRTGLPTCGGVALGFDRLAMIALGADDISDVIAFPADRA